VAVLGKAVDADEEEEEEEEEGEEEEEQDRDCLGGGGKTSKLGHFMDSPAHRHCACQIPCNSGVPKLGQPCGYRSTFTPKGVRRCTQFFCGEYLAA